MRSVYIVTLMLVSAIMPVLGYAKINDTWRNAKLTDVNFGENWLYRKNDKQYYLNRSADFDGDKIDDMVYIMVNKNTEEYGVFVTLSANGFKQEMISIGNLKYLNQIGVDLAKKGAYTGTCAGVGSAKYSVCGKIVHLENDGFSVFAFESSEVIYYVENKRVVSLVIHD